eukprot:TRINITY_DN16886_c0_g3_i2.p1 TRINITY_DN16886_c0_g3~~TRINITY_DN16886_c0_g3_i2.p1  ORF type:complete len:228 (+),score=26.21 TRINITY_DN16886_c0_g3_i2:98-781(+)
MWNASPRSVYTCVIFITCSVFFSNINDYCHKSMEFGCSYIYVPSQHASEDIFKDEIEDGIAASAQEQAKIWAAEVAARQGDISATDTTFYLQLAQLAAASYNSDASSRDANTHEAINHNLGAFSTTRRLQPRFQKGRTEEFDKRVADRIKEEKYRRYKATLPTSFTVIESVKELIFSRSKNNSTPEFLPIQANEDVNVIVLDLGSAMTKAGFGMFFITIIRSKINRW